MSNYTRVYNLTVKDALPTGNSGKVIKGAELDTELNAVASAISSKADTNSPTFTGVPLAPTASYGTSTTQLATTAFVQAALQALYPVGSVYINAASATSPATLLGFGTWASIGDGKVLVNQDTTDTSFDTLGETGGSKDAVVVSHNHTATSASTSTSTSTVTDPGHTHSYPHSTSGTASPADVPATGGSGAPIAINSNTTGITVATTTTTSTSTTIDSEGSSGTNANLQPYVVVKMWKRIS